MPGMKTAHQIAGIRRSCRLAVATLQHIEPHLRPGVSTLQLNDLAHAYIAEHGGTPACLGYQGFPKSICTAVNDVVCHGIPDDYQLRDGDIVGVDVACVLDGFYGDTCRTYPIGDVSPEAAALLKAARTALQAGCTQVRPGNYVGDIGAAVSGYAWANGYTVVEEFCGHGVGLAFHEEPTVAHVALPGTGPPLRAGMVFTVEPMINQGSHMVVVGEDGWTVRTADGKLSAQFEHTVVVTSDGCEILTLDD